MKHKLFKNTGGNSFKLIKESVEDEPYNPMRILGRIYNYIESKIKNINHQYEYYLILMHNTLPEIVVCKIDTNEPVYSDESDKDPLVRIRIENNVISIDYAIINPRKTPNHIEPTPKTKIIKLQIDDSYNDYRQLPVKLTTELDKFINIFKQNPSPDRPIIVYSELEDFEESDYHMDERPELDDPDGSWKSSREIDHGPDSPPHRIR